MENFTHIHTHKHTELECQCTISHKHIFVKLPHSFYEQYAKAEVKKNKVTLGWSKL